MTLLIDYIDTLAYFVRVSINVRLFNGVYRWPVITVEKEREWPQRNQREVRAIDANIWPAIKRLAISLVRVTVDGRYMHLTTTYSYPVVAPLTIFSRPSQFHSSQSLSAFIARSRRLNFSNNYAHVRNRGKHTGGQCVIHICVCVCVSCFVCVLLYVTIHWRHVAGNFCVVALYA